MDPLTLQTQFRNNSNDLVKFCEELKQWGSDMKRQDESLKSGTTSSTTDVSSPLPRSKHKKTSDTSQPKPVKKKSKSHKSVDYSAWEKYDVDAECAKLDEKSEDGQSSDLSDEYDESARDDANHEKEKGNKFVKHQRWDEAIECYTKAIESFGYDPIFYANRALCYLKKENYRGAESDCTTALQLDKTYVKAYQRRAAAREALNQLSEAHADLLKVFDYEAGNKESKVALAKLEKKLETFTAKKPTTKTTEVQRPKSKFTLSRQERSSTPAATSKSTEQPPKIATYWPSGNEVELVNAVFKSPHLRSKKPLRRINIVESAEIEAVQKSNNQDDVQSWPQPDNKSKVIVCDKLKVVERKIEDFNKNLNEKPKKESKFSKQRNNKLISRDAPSADEFNFVIPETSMQFSTDWRLLNARSDWRFRYLEQVNPKRFGTIFKESLDCDIFSGIVHTLAEMFIEKNVPVYDYLLGLCDVKRFSMLTMFMSNEDKKDLLKLVDYMRADNSLSQANVDNLMQKYGL